MKNPLLSALIASSLLPAATQAAVIGVESFSYADGAIAGKSGGIGFDYNQVTSVHTGTASDWDDVGGSPSVVGGSLITNNTSAKREFNGPTEGSAGADGDDSERAGAFRGAGVAFFRFDVTRTAGATWSGVSSYDFGTERIFFGVPNPLSGNDEAGIDGVPGGPKGSGIFLTDNITYTMVGVVDFNNDLLGLYVNPDVTDSWSPTGGTADVTLAYTGTNWSSAVRFGSGGEVAWDNLTVANNAADAGLLGVPEPSAAAFSVMGALSLLGRRRRR